MIHLHGVICSNNLSDLDSLVFSSYFSVSVAESQSVMPKVAELVARSDPAKNKLFPFCPILIS